MASNEDRIEKLLDQLENPHLNAVEIERIQKKIEFIKSLDE